MTATRTRKQINQYRAYQQSVAAKLCDFCDITPTSPQTIQFYEHFKLVRNIFPYSLWDNQLVDVHLLLIPIQHTDTLADITAEAAQQYVQIISDYESQGYNVYARAPHSTIKTVPHQHTHLMKLSDRDIRGLVHLKKPYIRLLWRA
jgi:ATP adenylyltransferase